ncbi:hypothetical protein [Nocardia tenerifensis]|uniref:hypothetical protein n=1 Tax=Nocardia tenerifensis TaxID=228006 RepID=UPI0011B41FC6|nr:hypothetical protein [Nocardia tenerifensis]
MPTPHRPLEVALLDFVRTNRRLTTETLTAHGKKVLSALVGGSIVSEPHLLAQWIIDTLPALIDRLPEQRDRWIAQIAFPMHEDFRGSGVGERIMEADRRGWFNERYYWNHRNRVAEHIAAGLRTAYLLQRRYADAADPVQRRPRLAGPAHDGSLRIFIAAYYEGSAWDPLAAALGAALMQRLPVPVRVSSMASKAALTVGYAVAEQARSMNAYTPELYTLYRRTESRRAQPILRFLGRTECLSGDINQVRRDILSRCDAMIVIGGDDGTAYETRLGDDLGVAVLPVGATGGAAYTRWGSDTTLRDGNPATAAAFRDLGTPCRAINGTIALLDDLYRRLQSSPSQS